MEPPNKWEDLLPVLKEWCEELQMRADGHRKAAASLRLLNRILGGLNVALAATTATAMFAALNQKLQNMSILAQTGITVVAVLPAISAGLQKEWQLVARENGHTMLAQGCRVLLKELKFFIAFPPEDFRVAITNWHARYVDVICRPSVPPRT